MGRKHLSILRRHMPWALVLLSLFLAVAGGIVSAAPAPANASPPVPADGCAGPAAGQHIYDCAHLLTPGEVSMLETRAAEVDRAGAPTVVYLQVRNATAQQTLQDAIDLMNRWNIESRPGARDGFVMFLNLQPGNLRHGQVALYAGAQHAQHNLPVAELTRIRTDVMTPLLANGQTADGIAAGLQMVASDLTYGPPPPPAYQTISAVIGRFPFNMLAALFAGLVALLFVRLARQAPVGGEPGSELLSPPAELPPAMAGALLNGRTADAQIEATILDFGHRGLLDIEPTSKKKVRMRLLRDDKGLSGYEREVWNGLSSRAGADRTLSSDDLAKVRQSWSGPKTLLRRELVERGWYDTEAAAVRRRPLYIAGALGMVGVGAGIILWILAQEDWAAIGVVIFLAAAAGAFMRGYKVPDTTVEGELAAAPWRAYRETVLAREYEPNLDTDLPYIVALGLVGKLAPRLKAASERGYAPSWFRGREDEGIALSTVGFYSYWIVLHGSMAPASAGSGSATGGFAGGGAAGGGVGSAGSF